MLHVEYEVRTKQGSTESFHVPDPKIENIPGNVMMIEGPNSSGKSTLMNLIAIGCGGENDQSLSPTMRSNLKELTESSYRNVTFDISVDDPKTGCALQLVRNNNGDGFIILDDEEISPQQFKQRFNLIYDIPEDPTARLKNIAKTIADDHRAISERIQSFGDYVRSIQKSLEDVKSKSEIESLRKDLVGARKELDDLKKQSPNQELIEKLRIILRIRKYRDLNDNAERTDRKLQFEKSKPAQAKIIQSNSTQLVNYQQSIDSLEPRFEDHLQYIDNIEITSGYSRLMNAWKELSKTDYTEHRDMLKQYSLDVLHLSKKMPNIVAEKRHLAQIGTVIKALRELDTAEIVGGLGTISDIISKLTDHMNSVANTDAINAYSKISEELSTFNNSIPKIQQQQSKLPTSSDSAQQITTARCRDPELISKLMADLDTIKKEQEEILISLKNDGITLQDYTSVFQRLCHETSISLTSSEKEIKDAIDQEQNKNGGVEKDIRRLTKYVNTSQDIIDDYDNNPRPAFADDKEEVLKLLNRIRTIRSKIGSADERLEDIEKHNLDEYEKNPEVYKPLWEYIGHRLGSVRDKGKEYIVKSVDLLIEQKGLITTEDGVEIHIGAMGTGEGQLSYIRGLLSADDDRMIIALFDEVGNMSNSTIDYVTQRLLELQNEGKLMIGMMVRPGDRMEVTTYGL